MKERKYTGRVGGGNCLPEVGYSLHLYNHLLYSLLCALSDQYDKL